MAASPTSPSSPDPSGAEVGLGFGPYRLLERISVGALSEAFLARGPASAELVVLKRLLPVVVDAQPNAGAAFLDAMGRLRAVRDPRVARVLDLGEEDGAPYAVTEHVAGVDLARILGRARTRGAGTWPRPLATYVAREVATALAAVHEAGLVAGDLSPGQVVVSYDGDVALLDAGLLPALRTDRALERGFLRGKVGYLSPEQVRGLPLDGRSDAFGLGALLSELLTSRPAFEGRGDFHTLELLQRLELAPPRMIDRTVPAELEAIVLRCLSREPADRYPSAEGLAADLDAALDRVGPGVGRGQLAAWLREAFLDELTRDRSHWARLRARELGTPAAPARAQDDASRAPGGAGAAPDAGDGPEQPPGDAGQGMPRDPGTAAAGGDADEAAHGAGARAPDPRTDGAAATTPDPAEGSPFAPPAHPGADHPHVEPRDDRASEPPTTRRRLSAPPGLDEPPPLPVRGGPRLAGALAVVLVVAAVAALLRC